MKRQLRNLRTASLVAALMCTTTLAWPTASLGEQLTIDMDSSDPSAGLPGDPDDATPGDQPGVFDPGDTLIIQNGVTLTPPADSEAVIYFDLDRATIINNGTIITFDGGNDSAWGDGLFHRGGDAATLINNGQINIGDFQGAGLSLWESIGGTSINNGQIFAAGDSSYGMGTWDSPGATVTNNGQIWFSGDATDVTNGSGILVSRSDDTTVVNNGTISHEAFYGDGILAYAGARQTIINNGAITITADGMRDNDDDPDGSAGPLTAPARDPSGAIYQTCHACMGIRVDSYNIDDVTNRFGTAGHLVVNNGQILSHALQSRGIYIEGVTPPDANDPTTYPAIWFSVNSTIINNSSIRMLSDAPSNATYDVSGMRIKGHHGTIINNGFIEINPRGFGIDIQGAGGEINNFGTITIDGENIENVPSYGIAHDRNGSGIDSAPTSLTVNTGTIIATGSTTTGLAAKGHAGHDVLNSGRILAMGGGYSIAFDLNSVFDIDDSTPGTNTLRLLDGSILYGDVFFNNAAIQNTTLRLGDGLNARVRFDTVNGGRPGDAMTRSHYNSHVWVGDSVYVADLDSYPQQDQALWHMATTLQGVLDSGTKPRQASHALRFADSGRNVWGRAFGGGFRDKQDDNSAAPAYKAGSGGVVAGTNTGRLQYFGGLAQTNVRGDEEVSYRTKSISGFGGLTGNVNKAVSYSVTAGAAVNSTDRDIADNTVKYGIETDSTNYASVFFMPSVRLAGPIKGSSVRLLYAGLWQQGHSFDFSGGTELDVDNRLAHFVQARFEMQHQLTSGLTFGYGAEASWSGANDISFNLMGTSLNTPYDGSRYGRIFAKIDFGFGFAEVGRDTEERTTVQAGARVKF